MASEQARRWLLIAQIADRLAVDSDLAEEFERTPGKVLRSLGVEPEDLAVALALVQHVREHAEAPSDDG